MAQSVATPLRGVAALPMTVEASRGLGHSSALLQGCPVDIRHLNISCGEHGVQSPEWVAYVVVFGGIALFVLISGVVAVRVRRAGDAEGLALGASDVRAQCENLLVGPDFLWSVWQNTDGMASMTMLIRDARDAMVTTITVPTVSLDGVLKRFDFGGTAYELYTPGAMSKRVCLRVAGHSEVLLSADHDLFQTRYYRGDGGQEMCRLPARSVLSRFRPCRVDGKEVGKLILGLKRNAYALVISVPEDQYSPLEQVFLLAAT